MGGRRPRRRQRNKNALMEHQKHFETNLDLLLKASTLPGEMDLTRQVATNYQVFLKAVDTIGSTNTRKTRVRCMNRKWCRADR